MKKVSAEQIQELYKFTRQHYVEHYDVQTELVDHLANDIETIWQQTPNVSFYEARDKSFKKFGVFGFMNMYEARQKSLRKKYSKILWQHAKEWFQLPKILATITLFLCFYTIFTIKYGKLYFIFVLLLLSAYEINKGTKLLKQQKKKEKQIGKKWLLEDLLFRVASLNGFLLASNSLNILGNISLRALSGEEQRSLPTYAALFFSLILVIGIIYAYISFEVLPKKAEELLNEQYPEYRLEKTQK